MSFEPFFTNLHSYYLNTLYTLILTPMCFIEKFKYCGTIMEAKLDIGLYTFSLEFLHGSSMLKNIQINIVSQVIHTQNDINYFKYFSLQVLFFMFPRLICLCLSIEFHFDTFCLTFHLYLYLHVHVFVNFSLQIIRMLFKICSHILIFFIV